MVRAQQSPEFPTAEELPWSLGLFGLIAGEAAFRDGVEWLDEVTERIAQRAAHVRDRLTRELPGVRMPTLEASYDVAGPARGAPRRRRPGHSHPGAHRGLRQLRPAFGSVGAGCVRINIGTSWEILDTLLDAIVATVRGS